MQTADRLSTGESAGTPPGMLGLYPARSADGELLESQRIRAAIRTGAYCGTSRGQAAGFVQCNLVAIPERLALDFMRYCLRNQRACPVLDMTAAGDPEPARLAPGADLRTDVARYSVFRDGQLIEQPTDVLYLWRSDLVAVLIGSGITFDAALERSGVPTDRYRWVLRTALPATLAGPFHGPLCVTMRWLTPADAVKAVQVTSRFPLAHGAPIHIGDPAVIEADLDQPMFGGPVPSCPEHLVPVFWVCGVTPQEAALAARTELMITHAPAHSFITDVPASQLESA